MSSQPYKPRTATSLKAAVSRAVSDLGGFPIVAGIPGVNRSASTLFKYSDEGEDHASHNIPMDVAAVITKEAVRQGKTPHLLHWMQEQTSDVPADVRHLTQSMSILSAHFGKEVGDVFSRLAQVLDPAGAQGADLSQQERRDLGKEFQDVIDMARAGLAKLQGAA